MGDDRPTRYVEDDVVVYRASGLGSCNRALVAIANGYPPAPKPEWFQAVLDQGTAFEDVIRDAYVEQEGVEVVGDQQECELELGEMFGKTVIVRGHTDGHHDNTLFEAKKFRDSTWQNFIRQGIEVNVNYPWQVSVYMLALDLEECAFVGGHVVEREELGVGTGEWDLTEIAVKRIPSPPFSLKAVRKRIYEIEKLIDTGFDAKEVPCNIRQYPCPFYKLHDWDEDEFEWEGEHQETADAWMLSYAAVDEQVRGIKAQLKAAEDKKREVAKGMREFIAESGDAAVAAKKLLGTDYTVTHVVKEIAEHTRKASKQDYFTITANKKGDKDAAS